MRLSQVRHRQVSLPSGFLLRLVDADIALVRGVTREPIRGAILATRCLAAPSGGELLHAVRTMRVPFLMDPDTAVLAEVEADNERALWLQAMPAGAAVRRIPVHPSDLEDPRALESFARAVLSAQNGAAALSAGYFRVTGPDDPWRSVNARLLEVTRQLAAGRPTAAWLEVPLTALEGDLVTLLASELRGANVLVLRIAGLRTWSASEDEAFAVLGAVASARASGAAVILDSVGTLGVAALAIGAHAISGAPHHHRSVPLTLVHRRAPRGTKLGWEVALEFRQLDPDDAVGAVRAGRVDPCPVADCRALAVSRASERPRALREHFRHAAEADASWATHAPAADVAAQLQACSDPAVQAWGRALSRFAAAQQASIHSPR